MGLRQFGHHILAFQEQANTVRACESLGIAEELGQGGTGPGRHHIKGLGRGILYPEIADDDRQSHALGGGGEEGAFLGGGFVEGHGHLAAQHFRQDQPRKAGAGAQIGQSTGLSPDQGHKLGGIPEVAVPDIVEGFGGNQVMTGIPVGQNIRIGLEMGQCFT